MAGGRFFVKLDVVPHPADDRRSAKHYHVMCNVCQGVVETVKSLQPEQHDLHHKEACQIAGSLDSCDICGAGATIPFVAEPALVAAQS